MELLEALDMHSDIAFFALLSAFLVAEGTADLFVNALHHVIFPIEAHSPANPAVKLWSMALWTSNRRGPC